MREYDKESFWQECLKNKPDLTRIDFDRRWNKFWFWVNLLWVPA